MYWMKKNIIEMLPNRPGTMRGSSVFVQPIASYTIYCGSNTVAYGTIIPLRRRSSQNVLWRSRSFAKENAARLEKNVPTTITDTSTMIVLRNPFAIGTRSKSIE